MNYQEELRKLKKEQERLDCLREKTSMLYKKVGYSAILLGAIGLIVWSSTLWWYGITGKEFLPAILAVAQGLGMFIGALSVGVAWFFDMEDSIRYIDDFFDGWSESARLAKTEKDRKAKIDFFERLINDPDFRSAWEAQMNKGDVR